MTSVVIGLGIVFCGGAVIHNVFIWQRVSAMMMMIMMMMMMMMAEGECDDDDDNDDDDGCRG